MASPTSFYVLEHGGKTFRFKKPTTQQLDHFTSRAARSMVSAAIQFTQELCEDEGWAALVQEMPGLAVRAVNGILETLGFPTV